MHDDRNQVAAFQEEQARQSKSDLDTARINWCEANLNNFGWVGTRVVICDHAGTADSAATFRRVVDVAMERISPKLGDSARIDHVTATGLLDLTTLRYQMLVKLVTGKHAQQFLTEMCWDGSAPTQKQLEAKLDKMIEATR
jgi:hypothetical protein